MWLFYLVCALAMYSLCIHTDWRGFWVIGRDGNLDDCPPDFMENVTINSRVVVRDDWSEFVHVPFDSDDRDNDWYDPMPFYEAIRVSDDVHDSRVCRSVRNGAHPYNKFIPKRKEVK